MSTTIVTDEATVLNEEIAERPRTSWASIFIGAVVAVSTTLFLLLLGSGIGLALGIHLRSDQGVHFLTLGAIYFVAAQAFGLALGGHLTGRLIGPAIETSSEEEFRAGAHGLAMWALAVLATAALVILSGVVAQNAAMNIRTVYGAPGDVPTEQALPAATGYWVDVLFRPSPATAPANTHASLDGVQYAQNDTGTENDASPNAPPSDQTAPSNPPPETFSGGQSGSTTPPSPRAPSTRAPVDVQSSPPAAGETVLPSGEPTTINGSTLPPAQTPRNIGADKVEVARILDMDMSSGGFLSPEDRGRVAELVAQDANLSFEAATARANDVQSRIHNAQARAADTARKIAEYASLWMALALLFGAIVATVATVSARWEDDMQQMFVFPRRSETYS